MPVELILRAENKADAIKTEQQYIEQQVRLFLFYTKITELNLFYIVNNSVSNKKINFFQHPQHTVGAICQATDKQLIQLVEWAKHIPHFKNLPLGDQVLLLRAGK